MRGWLFLFVVFAVGYAVGAHWPSIGQKFGL